MTRHRAFLALLVIAALALALAYQIRTPIALDMSASSSIYLTHGFYPPETAVDARARWTNGDAQIRLAGLGSGVPLRAALELHEFRPPPLTLRPVTIKLNGRALESFTPGAALATYVLDLPTTALDPRGDVIIGLSSDTFIPRQTMDTSDDRRLGLFIRQIAIEHGPGLIIPPMWVWALLVIGVISVHGLGRVLGWNSWLCLGLGLLTLVAEITAILKDRLWVARNSEWFALTAFGLCLAAWRLKTSRPSPADHSPREAAYGQSPVSNLQSPILFILAVFLAWRIALIFVPVVGADLVGVSECCPQVDPTPLTSVWQAATERWYRWDAIWYGDIAQNGYQYFGERAASNVAFFPLFPLVNGIVMRMTNLPVQTSGPLASSLLTLLACWLFYRLTWREAGDAETAGRSVSYLLAFPVAFYLAIGYSEALYLLCVVAAFWWARQGRWGVSGLAAFFAGLTRLHGALLIVPLGYEYVRQRGFRLTGLRADGISVVGGPLGVLAYISYLGLQFGHPMAYFQVQALFFRGIRAGAFPTFPGVTLANYLQGLFSNPPSTESVIETSAILLILMLTLEAWARLPRVYGVYMLTFAAFSLTSGDLISLPRFALPMFPGFMALGLMGRHAWVDRILLIGFVLLQGVLALMFANGYWIA